jgi:SIR2-like domain
VKLNPNDLEHLKKAVLSNSANLFLGAGFSTDATNALGQNIPAGAEFAKILWQFMGYPGDYDGSPLQQIFDAALAKKKGSEIQALLNQCFRCASIPDWYALPTQFFWRRIFTTNVDDVIETAFHRFSVRQQLNVINGISDDYQERDLLLEKIQFVKLNGTLTDNPKSITFSARQYASRIVENSNADYSVLFREASGEASQAQFHGFTDTWSWLDSAAHAAQSVKRKKVAGSNCAAAKPTPASAPNSSCRRIGH